MGFFVDGLRDGFLRRRLWPVTALLSAALALATLIATSGTPLVAQATRFDGPLSSQPLALSANGAFLASVNPDNNSVTFFDLRADRNRRIAEVPVQSEPNGVAFLPNGSRAFVANTVSGTVSVIRVNIANGGLALPHKHIRVGTEPYSLVMSPNGTMLYVANARSNDISVIDTASETVVRTIFNVGVEPRGLAMTNDGDDDDTDEKLYVTQFLSLPVPAKIDGADDAKAGHVTVISTLTNNVIGDVTLNPIANTGFNAEGDALARIPPSGSFIFPTGA